MLSRRPSAERYVPCYCRRLGGACGRGPPGVRRSWAPSAEAQDLAPHSGFALSAAPEPTRTTHATCPLFQLPEVFVFGRNSRRQRRSVALALVALLAAPVSGALAHAARRCWCQVSTSRGDSDGSDADPGTPHARLAIAGAAEGR
jgi:hypothetical protein